MQDLCLQVADRFDDVRRQQLELVRDARQMLDGVQDQARGGVHQGRIVAGDDGAVPELDGGAAEDPLVALCLVFCASGAACRAGATTVRSSGFTPAPP